MNQSYPVPPPELVASLRNSAPHGIRDAGVTRELWLINKAYAAGADMELEACCEWLGREVAPCSLLGSQLRAARRPKPPSLKEQALETLNWMESEASYDKPMIETIRRALEALDD